LAVQHAKDGYSARRLREIKKKLWEDPMGRKEVLGGGEPEEEATRSRVLEALELRFFLSVFFWGGPLFTS
jgi:hypothetical protein